MATEGTDLPAVDLRRLPSSVEADVFRDGAYFPVLVVPRGEEVLAVVRTGAGHIGITGRLSAIRSTDGGRTWGPPKVIVDSEADDRNPAVGVAPDGTVVLAYHWQNSYDPDGKYNSKLHRIQMRITSSPDGGASWADARPLGFAPMEKFSAYGRIVALPDGTMLMPIYGWRVDEANAWKAEKWHFESHLLRSRDNGRTWGDPSLIADGHNETALLPLPGGELLAAVRREEKGAYLSLCRSSDGGRTWTAPSPVTGPSEHPADLALLSNGWVVLCFGVRHAPLGVQAIVSRDGGRSWDPRRLTLAEGLPTPDLGYPSTVRIGDRVVTAYYSAPKAWDIKGYLGEGTFTRALAYSERELIEALR